MGRCKSSFKSLKSMLGHIVPLISLTFAKEMYQCFGKGGVFVDERTREVSETEEILDVFPIE